MKEDNVVSTVFKGKVNDWCKARFITIDDGGNEDGTLHYVLYAVYFVDVPSEEAATEVINVFFDEIAGISVDQ